MTKLTESLDHLAMKNQVKDTITVDEYVAKMGEDSAIVTITFTVNSKLAADDLVTWFERGYDWVLDASVSDGELDPGKWLVFVEMDRRSKVPERICTLLADLETLTGRELSEWKVDVGGDEVEADEDRIRDLMILNPNEYKELKGDNDEETDDTDLNEYRELAGIDVTTVIAEEDEYIKRIKSMAGL